MVQERCLLLSGVSYSTGAEATEYTNKINTFLKKKKKKNTFMEGAKHGGGQVNVQQSA